MKYQDLTDNFGYYFFHRAAGAYKTAKLIGVYNKKYKQNDVQ